MPVLQVRDLPEHLYNKLKTSASREHRSLSQEAIVILARGLEMPEKDPKSRRAALIEQKKSSPKHKTFTDPVSLVREDRNR